MRKLPDVHRRRPEVEVALQKVGVTSVKMPVGTLVFGQGEVLVIPTFDAYIDLPMNLKGINASRNYEVIMDAMRTCGGTRFRLEDICAKIAEELLARHDYASRSEVKANGEVFIEKKAPKTGLVSNEPYTLLGSASATRVDDKTIKVSRTVGVEAVGITTCPCAQEGVKQISMDDLSEKCGSNPTLLRNVVSRIPLATHMQRCYSTLTVEIPEDVELDARELVKVVDESMSGATYGLLKRVDEAEVVISALLNPRFAEDCVRFMAKNLAKNFPNLPDDTNFMASTRSLESIHKHDFVAQVQTTLGEVRQQKNEQ